MFPPDIPIRNRVVRDLLWVIASPVLISKSVNSCRWISDDWCDEVYRGYRDELIALDKNPAVLQKRIASQTDKRLGRYFETLLAHWLETDERYELLAKNLPVRDHGHTIGEFDFIVRDKPRDKTFHLEVAVKFYLGVGEPCVGESRADSSSIDDHDIKNLGRPDCWHGPGLRDRLDKKIKRLCEHQSQLRQHPVAAELLHKHHLVIEETRVMLKGRLYYPYGSKVASNESGSLPEFGPGHLRGDWLTQTAFLDHFRDTQDDWYRLDKHEWLSPITMDDDISPVGATDLIQQLSQVVQQRPVCVAAVSAGCETGRVFIVPNDWPARVVINTDSR